MTRKSLFFVAILIPEPLRSEIRRCQEYAAEHYHSKAALRTPPHITLVPPFHAADSQSAQIIYALRDVSGTQKRFEIALDGFNSFGKRVIYVHVSSGRDLEILALRLNNALIEQGTKINTEVRSYHPHVTIAYKDLGSEVFDEAFAHFHHVQLSGTFNSEKLALLKHQHGRWHVEEEFKF